MRFTKMQGLGNDYVYLNCTGGLPDNLPELAVRLSDRHFGVGADGLICICPSERADFGMRIFNADGSEGAMCGNGIRCLGKYVYDKGLTRKTSLLTVETASGVRYLELFLRDGLVQSVLVDMGRPELSPPVSSAASSPPPEPQAASAKTMQSASKSASSFFFMCFPPLIRLFPHIRGDTPISKGLNMPAAFPRRRHSPAPIPGIKSGFPGRFLPN